MEQIRGEIPDSTTSVVEIDNERVGRLRITRTAHYIELCGIQLLPGVQSHGTGTAIAPGTASSGRRGCRAPGGDPVLCQFGSFRVPSGSANA
jgi:hypothetical protein